MLKKVLTYTIYTLIVAIFVTYFYFASSLKVKAEELNKCNTIKVTILDSLENRFISKEDVKRIITGSDHRPIGGLIKDLNINQMEEFLNMRNVIKNSDISIDRNGIMYISVRQRRPVIRIQSQHGGFYIDDTQYVFPLVNTFSSYVPLVTGHIPLKLKEGARGQVEETQKGWTKQILELSDYLNNNSFWNKQIQQIHINKNGETLMFTKVGDQTIRFGNLEDIEYKFQKLASFYKSIIPIKGWEMYSDIKLDYSNQIVCTKRK